MNNKPISPAMHGIVDYVYCGLQLIVPPLTGMSRKAVNTYRATSLTFIGVNAVTATTPGNLAPLLSIKDHQKADLSFLAAQAMLTLSKPILKNKRTLGIHLGFVVLAVANYLLTDYDRKNEF